MGASGVDVLLYRRDRDACDGVARGEVVGKSQNNKVRAS